MRELITILIFLFFSNLNRCFYENEKLVKGFLNSLNLSERNKHYIYQKYFDEEALIYLKRMNFDLVKKGIDEIKQGFLEIINEFTSFRINMKDIFSKSIYVITEVELNGKLKNGVVCNYKSMFKFDFHLQKIHTLRIYMDTGNFMRISAHIDLWRY